MRRIFLIAVLYFTAQAMSLGGLAYAEESEKPEAFQTAPSAAGPGAEPAPAATTTEAPVTPAPVSEVETVEVAAPS